MPTDGYQPGLTEIGLRWHPSGAAGFTGPLLQLIRDLDCSFLRLTRVWRPSEEAHPTTLSAAWMEKFGYLRSFPHQATFAVQLDTNRANMEAFADGPIVRDNAVVLTRPAPITEVLTPAACYHLYAAHCGESFSAAQYLTTHNTCFRQEHEYMPLQRQRSFSMREFVCIGTDSETTAFLDHMRMLIDAFAAAIDLPLHWVQASDPFFRPNTDPRHLLQRIVPIKYEATFDHLAITSLNQHFDHFGAAASLTRDGVPAHSACAAFGLDRWLSAITERYGTTPSKWPDLTAAVTHTHGRREEALE